MRRLRSLGRRLPGPLRSAAHRLLANRALRRRLRPVRWGNLRRLEPVSPRFGSDRGTPVDRYYIDAFFAAHSSLIRGRVLEVKDRGYTERFGRGVTSCDVVDIDPRNDEATIVADLADPGSLPEAAYDCAIVPQTLVYVADLDAAVANLWLSLAPGGSLLVTTPAIARVDPEAVAVDRWHLTGPGLETLLRRACPGAEIDVAAHGNPVVAVAFLHGLAVEDLRPGDLAASHEGYPIVATGVARKALA